MHSTLRKNVTMLLTALLMTAGGISASNAQEAPAGWRLDVAGAPAVAAGDILTSVSCRSEKLCFAVGWTSTQGEQRPLVLRRDAGGWHRELIAGAFADALLSGVDCMSDTHCVAIGYYVDREDFRRLPLTAEWTGSSWQLDGTPYAQSIDSRLTAVDCTPEGCMAVGRAHSQVEPGPTSDKPEYNGYALAYNGDGWLPAGALDVPTNSEEFASISCRTSQECLAVGNTQDVSTGLPEISSAAFAYDGSAWTRVPGAPGLSLAWTSCHPHAFCMVGGDSEQSTYRLSSGRWATDEASQGSLAAECFVSEQCIAVGTSRTPGGSASFPNASHFDAGAWQAEEIDLGADPRALRSISCPREEFCLAIGDRGERGEIPLIAIRGGQQPSPAAALTISSRILSTTVNPDPGDSAQATVLVVVRDAGGQPVPGAIITTSTSRIPFRTDSRGELRLVETLDIDYASDSGLATVRISALAGPASASAEQLLYMRRSDVSCRLTGRPAVDLGPLYELDPSGTASNVADYFRSRATVKTQVTQYRLDIPDAGPIFVADQKITRAGRVIARSTTYSKRQLLTPTTLADNIELGGDGCSSPA